MADGFRNDGKPYKEGNTREDGSYCVGKNRTPVSTRFAVGDGRKRSHRPKGSKNYDTDWEEELSRRVILTRDGKRQRVSAHRATVMKAMELAAKGKERSQELVFRQAGRLAERNRKVSTASDDALIAAWLAQQGGQTEGPIVSDDLDGSSEPPSGGAGDDLQGGDHDDQ